jgi:membrane protease YdiL (CAAX protease family)
MQSIFKNIKREALSLIVFIVIFFGIWSLYLFWGSPYLGLKLNNSYLHKTLNALLKIVIFVLPAFLYLKYYDYVNPITYLKLNTKRWGLKYVAVVSIFGALIYLVAQYVLFRNIKFDPFFDIFLWVNGVMFAGFTEELVFRGVILQKTNELMSFWKANAVSAMLFVLIHYPQWIYSHQITSLVTQLQMFSVFCVGLTSGYVLKKSNSLIPCILIHSILNFIGLSLNFRP